MKVYVMESRKINHTNFRRLDMQWNFFCVFASEEMCKAYIAATTVPGAVWYGYLELRYTEQEIYGSGE